MKLLILLVSLLALVLSKDTFNNHRVVRLHIQNETQLELLNKLVAENYLDVWSDYYNDIMLPPHLHNIFVENGFKQTIFIPDVQVLIDQSDRINAIGAPGEFFDAYRTTTEVMQFVNDLAAAHPDLVTTQEIGKTYSGKSILAVHVHSNKGENKPRIVYNSCQHAREWITVPTINWVLNELVTKYGTNETITNLVDTIDWTFIPITNIDGYDFTWSNNRLWRKTRKPNPGSSCVGVDPNRNWEYRWNSGGSSSDPCSDIFHGPRAGSEVEPLAVANFLKATPRVAGYMDIHSYSQLFMSPWGYTAAYPSDYQEMLNMMNSVVSAIRGVHNRAYRPGSVGSILYIASGSAVDFGYGTLGIVHSYTIELRDTGQYGFVLPPNQIRPQAEEFMEGTIAMAEHIKSEWYAAK